MGKALYRKYRSKKLSEIVGQEHITTALSNALKNGKISHAYLFTGPRGVGKTSIARILAYEINGLPYDEDATNMDIIEIDAASNRRIDEIRELRERVRTAPTSAKYKVYIIDEVHMLTREAFNALLKTLEEPPEHAVFILATTESHKLPETIVSRTQRYSFRPIDRQKAVDHLKSIAKQEKIKISDEALHLVAEHGDGSFRDSISLLDQLRNTGDEITAETVQQSLGIAPNEAVNTLLTALENQQPTHVLEQLHEMQVQGFHAPQIAKQLAEKLREDILSANSKKEHALLLRNLLDVPTAHDPFRLLEIILLEAALSGSNSDQQPVITKKLAKAEAKAEPKPAPVAVPEPEPIQEPEEILEEVEVPSQDEPKELDALTWQQILQAIKAQHNTLYSVTRMAVPRFDDDEITLAFSFAFHQKRLNEAKNKQIITDIIQKTVGRPIIVTCVVDSSARKVPAAAEQPHTPDPSLENISNIFGGAEVLE